MPTLHRLCAFFSIAALTGACGSSIESAAGASTSEGASGVGGASEGGASNGGAATGGSGGAAEGGNGGSGGSGPVCPDPPAPQPFELGTGESCFERTSDGDVVPLMQGPQGGYHVWLAVGCSGADCDSPIHLKWGVRDAATHELLANTYESESIVDLKGDSFLQRAGLVDGMPGISWDPETYPPLPMGTAFIMYLQRVDDAGTVLDEIERELVVGETIVWDPCAEHPELPECMTG